MATLTDLPDAILHHCMSILGDPHSFRSLEKSCRCFRNFFHDDQAWKHSCLTEADSFWNESFRESEYCIRDEDPAAPIHEDRDREDASFRDEAFRESALDMIYWYQSDDYDPILLDAFTRKNGLSRTLFHQVELHVVDVCNAAVGYDRFCLRGDASTFLIQTVENSLIQQLKSAMRLAVHRTKHGKYPSVSASDLLLQDQVRQDITGCLEPLVPSTPYNYSDASEEDQEEVNEVVRRLAYRAGIAKMENDLYSFVWAALKNMITLLLRPGCIELASRRGLRMFSDVGESSLEDYSELLDSPNEKLKFFVPNSWYEHVYLDEGEHWWTALPNPVYSLDDGRVVRGHMIMPWHITDAAKRLGIHSAAYVENIWYEDDDEEQWTETPATGPPKRIVKLMFVEKSAISDGDEGECENDEGEEEEGGDENEREEEEEGEDENEGKMDSEEDLESDFFEEESLASVMEF